MRNLKPKIKIDKFSGSGEGMLYYNEGFIAGNENGNSLLSEGYSSGKIFDNTDTEYITLSNGIKAIQYLKTIKGLVDYSLMLSNRGEFLVNSMNTTYIKNAVGPSLSASSSYFYSLYPDLLELPSGNLIFSSTNHLGLVIRGYCLTGSSTTKIVDGAGRNFETLGLSTTGINNKVWNLKTGEVFTITSISTTNSTNDTLNFSAGTANTTNDEFIAVVWDKWDLTTDIIPVPNYSANDKRQIKQYADYFYVLNNRYLARLDSDESTFYNKSVVGENKGKELPVGHTAQCFDVNTDKILVSSRKSNGENFLLLWDGYADGWNNIIPISGDVNDVKAYNSGWVFVLEGTLYYTDGYSLSKISNYNDTLKLNHINRSNLTINSFNSIVVLKDSIYMASGGSNLNRVKTGVYVYDFNYGWSFVPITFKGRMYNRPTSIFYNYSNNEINVGLFGGLSYISSNGTNTSQYLNKSAIWMINLDEESQIFGVGLNISANLTSYIRGNRANQKTKITVSIGDANKGLIYNYNGRINGTGNIITSRSYDPVDVGDEIIIIDQDSRIRGERTFVQTKNIYDEAISLTVDPYFSQNDNNPRSLQVLKLKKCDTKEISLGDLNREQMFFNPNPFFSNKLFVQITIQGITNSFPVSILGINIY